MTNRGPYFSLKVTFSYVRQNGLVPKGLIMHLTPKVLELTDVFKEQTINRLCLCGYFRSRPNVQFVQSLSSISESYHFLKCIIWLFKHSYEHKII